MKRISLCALLLVSLFAGVAHAQYDCIPIVAGPPIYHDLINTGTICSRQYITVNVGTHRIQNVPIINGWSPSITEHAYADGTIRRVFDYSGRRVWTGSTNWTKSTKDDVDNYSRPEPEQRPRTVPRTESEQRPRTVPRTEPEPQESQLPRRNTNDEGWRSVPEREREPVPSRQPDTDPFTPQAPRKVPFVKPEGLAPSPFMRRPSDVEGDKASSPNYNRT